MGSQGFHLQQEERESSRIPKNPDKNPPIRNCEWIKPSMKILPFPIWKSRNIQINSIKKKKGKFREKILSDYLWIYESAIPFNWRVQWRTLLAAGAIGVATWKRALAASSPGRNDALNSFYGQSISKGPFKANLVTWVPSSLTHTHPYTLTHSHTHTPAGCDSPLGWISLLIEFDNLLVYKWNCRFPPLPPGERNQPVSGGRGRKQMKPQKRQKTWKIIFLKWKMIFLFSGQPSITERTGKRDTNSSGKVG